MTQFSSWRAFRDFEQEVRRNRRYVRSETSEAFLTAVRSTLKSRVSNISKGRGFWRAQVGNSWRQIDGLDVEIPSAFPPKRMKPLPDRAMDGRANPKGIPMLYVCSNKVAAMSEVRPWIGSLISLGYFETKSNLRVIDCSSTEQSTFRKIYEKPEPHLWDGIVWSDIDRAFTKPVTRSDDTSDYVATQILVELFRDAGFDGISYKSAFGTNSKNFAFFDLNCVYMSSCQLHETSSMHFNFRERDQPYWVKSVKKSTPTGV